MADGYRRPCGGRRRGMTIPAMPVPDGELWVCHDCALIGTREDAARHIETTGHPVERLDSETAKYIRAERQRRHEEFVRG